MIQADIMVNEDLLSSLSYIHHPSGVTRLHKDVIIWAVSCLSSRRMELQALAIAKLPVRITDQLALHANRPLDSLAQRLVEELQTIEIHILRLLILTDKPLFIASTRLPQRR